VRRRTGTVLGAQVQAGLIEHLRLLLAPGGVRAHPSSPWPAQLARMQAGEAVEPIPGWQLTAWVPGPSESRWFSLSAADELSEVPASHGEAGASSRR
jgi:hypothetical protein